MTAKCARRRAAIVVLALLGASTLLAAAAGDPARAVRAVLRLGLLMEGAAYQGRDDVVLQRTPFDCGPAALANLLAARGRPVPPVDSLARLAGTTARGTSLGALALVAGRLGLRVEVLHLEPASAPAPAHLPMVAWVRRSHFVVVLAGPSDSVLTVVDPQVGRYRIPVAVFRRRWSGEAMVPVRPPRS